MPNDGSDQTIVTRLRLATTQLSRRMRQESGTTPALTPSGYAALSSIEAYGPLRMTELAVAERVSKSSITRIVGSLAGVGLAALLPDPTDGRSTLVGVTPEGTRVLSAAAIRNDAYLAHQVEAFSAAEQAMVDVVVRLLERLAAKDGARSSTV